MDVSHILEHLNDQQRSAVTSEKQHLMVLAGAGSGKTRVLVHKIAWEVEALRKNPASIMAVTFTNKAALEMRSRIEELLEAPMMDGWVGTFHGLAHRMLKRFHKEAGLSSGFTILDADDQLRIIKRISKEAGLDESVWPSRQSQWQINAWKDEGFRSESAQTIRSSRTINAFSFCCHKSICRKSRSLRNDGNPGINMVDFHQKKKFHSFRLVVRTLGLVQPHTIKHPSVPVYTISVPDNGLHRGKS